MARTKDEIKNELIKTKDKRNVIDSEFSKKREAALRSGQYTQIQTSLSDGDGGFCCLGVACKVGDLPGTVTSDGYNFLEYTLGIPKPREFYHLNDRLAWTFDDIADYLEARRGGSGE